MHLKNQYLLQVKRSRHGVPFTQLRKGSFSKKGPLHSFYGILYNTTSSVYLELIKLLRLTIYGIRLNFTIRHCTFYGYLRAVFYEEIEVKRKLKVGPSINFRGEAGKI